MTPADAAQCEALRLAELNDTLNRLQDLIFSLAYAEITEHHNLDVGTQLDQAQLKLRAAIQVIAVQLRTR